MSNGLEGKVVELRNSLNRQVSATQKADQPLDAAQQAMLEQLLDEYLGQHNDPTVKVAPAKIGPTSGITVGGAPLCSGPGEDPYAWEIAKEGGGLDGCAARWA